MPAPPSRRSIGRHRNPDSHRAILDAGRALLREGGAHAASIEAIARRSAAGKPTIYRWWRMRAELMFEIYESAHASVAWPHASSGVNALADHIAALVHLWSDDVAGAALRAILCDALTDVGARLLVAKKVIPPTRTRFWRLIELSGDAGLISLDAPIDGALDLLVDGLHFALLYDRLPARTEQAHRLATNIWRMMAAEELAHR